MKPIFTFILLLAAFPVFAQVNNKKIKQQAELTAKALIEGDYETLIKFTYPKIVEMMGGRQKMISVIKKGKEDMAQQGISFESATFGEPFGTVTAGNEIHCLVPQTLFMKMPNGKLKSQSHLLAISKDKGVNWFFLDLSNVTLSQIKKIIPNYNTTLLIPAKKQPEFIEN